MSVPGARSCPHAAATATNVTANRVVRRVPLVRLRARDAKLVQTFVQDANVADTEQVRLDKWLWAARFFKTRSLAADAIDGGKVQVNGDRVKRAKEVRAGDMVRVRLGPYEHHVKVLVPSDHRGPAVVARTLYEETSESVTAREKLRDQLSLLPSAFVPAAERPTKRDRRKMDRFRGR